MDGTYTEKVNYKAPKLDEYGNPVINMKSMKATSRGFFKMMRTKGKRGRPRTRPERTTPKRPYKRSYNFTKAKIAERKAAARERKAMRQADRESRPVKVKRPRAPRAPKIKFSPFDHSKSIQENLAVMAAVKKAKGKNKLPVVLGPFS
jgi:hypothetical protein